MEIKSIFWILFGALVSAIPVTLIKLYTETKQIFLLFLSVICYLLVLVSYVHVFEKGDIITFYIIMKIALLNVRDQIFSWLPKMIF